METATARDWPGLNSKSAAAVAKPTPHSIFSACEADGRPLGPEGVLRLLERFAGKPLRERIDGVAALLGALGLRDDATLLGVSDEARG